MKRPHLFRWSDLFRILKALFDNKDYEASWSLIMVGEWLQADPDGYWKLRKSVKKPKYVTDFIYNFWDLHFRVPHFFDIQSGEMMDAQNLLDIIRALTDQVSSILEMLDIASAERSVLRDALNSLKDRIISIDTTVKQFGGGASGGGGGTVDF